jgi:hydrogenase expression/formation protein HypE
LRVTDEKILLAHGGGGELTAALIRDVIIETLGEAAAGELEDSVVIENSGRVAFTTDSYVVKPLFFPGGDLGRLAVCGTVNDLAMRAARPLGLSLALIIEEGLELSVLRRICGSIREAALEVGVCVVTGDTKVVERGGADGIFINTAGVGEVVAGASVSLAGVREGDRIIVSGPVGNHAIAVLAKREGLAFETTVKSDAAPLWGEVKALIDALGADLHALNDPTRGGLAGSLNNLAASSGVSIEIEESEVPVDGAVAFAAEMLGLDVLNLANEGKLVAAVAPGRSEEALAVLAEKGAKPAVIGIARAGSGVTAAAPGGGRRVLETPYGEDAPRIC